MIGRTQFSTAERDEEFYEQFVEQNFHDEAAVRRVVDEIDNACDLKDWTRCRSYFTGEIEVDFKSLSGEESAKIPADDLIAAWRKNLFEDKKTCHLRSNHSIKIDGKRAEVFSKAYAFNLLETGEVTGLWEVWGIYFHELLKTETGWKCSAMKLEVIHQRGDKKVRTFEPDETPSK